MTDSKQIFITATSNTFAESVKFEASEKAEIQKVRRPLRGIVLKENSYATLSVINELGEIQELTNESVSEDAKGKMTSNFILTSVREDRVERAQVVNTFGDSYIYFYGQNPPAISGSGLLLNTADFQWSAEFWENYEKNFRGTALARQRRRVILDWDEELVCGYFLRASVAEDSERRNVKSLSFQMVVTDRMSKHAFTSIAPKSGFGVSLDQLKSFRERMAGITGSTSDNRIALMEAYAKAKSEKYDGFLGAIQEGVDTVKGALGYLERGMDEVRDFLYGNPLTIPKGYAASEYMVGPAEYAAGSIDPSTGLPDIVLSDEGGALARTVELKGTFAEANLGFTKKMNTDGKFFIDNKDEFVTGDSFPSLEDQYQIAYTAATSQSSTNEELEKRAKEMLEKFGLEEPSEPSVAMALAGKATFAALSVGARFL